VKWKVKIILHPSIGKESHKEVKFETITANHHDRIYEEAKKHVRKVVSKYPFFIEAYSWEVFPDE
jgi:antibiotic biosynthesis monooxygenase (ABM) superfamily enzyme